MPWQIYPSDSGISTRLDGPVEDRATSYNKPKLAALPNNSLTAGCRILLEDTALRGKLAPSEVEFRPGHLTSAESRHIVRNH